MVKIKWRNLFKIKFKLKSFDWGNNSVSIKSSNKVFSVKNTVTLNCIKIILCRYLSINLVTSFVYYISYRQFDFQMICPLLVP